jgi:hypothetical protein
VFVVEVCQHYRGALLGERAAEHSANTACAASDDRHFAR